MNVKNTRKRKEGYYLTFSAICNIISGTLIPKIDANINTKSVIVYSPFSSLESMYFTLNLVPVMIILSPIVAQIKKTK